MDVVLNPERDRIFFSYSRRDKSWLEEFQRMLSPVLRNNSVFKIWADTDIQPGDKWKKEIEQALESSRVAVLLVSGNFLASDFINKYELPTLLEAEQKKGLIILLVYVSACLYKWTPIAEYHAPHDISKPLDRLSTPKRKHVISEICEAIIMAYKNEFKSESDIFSQDEPDQIQEVVRYR